MELFKKFLCLACLLCAGIAFAEGEEEEEEDPSVPHIISAQALAKIYNSDGSLDTDWSGGGHGIWMFFDGNFDQGIIIGPNGRLNNGGFCLIDFTSELEGGYYVTEIKIGSTTTHKYSVYISKDGTTFTPVPDGTQVSAVGTKTFIINDVVSKVKVVFDQIGAWTSTISEIEVWGLDPFYIACTHPSYSEWVPVIGSNTCTENGQDSCYCTVCGEMFYRESTTLLKTWHIYETILEKKGKVTSYGKGYVACSKCDIKYDFQEPVNLNTIGGEKTPGIKRFVDISATSIGNPDWGVTLSDIWDGVWNMQWNHYWYSVGNANQYLLYEPGVELDLAYIEMSIPNDGMIVQFYSVDGAAETPINNFKLYRQKVELESADGTDKEGNPITTILVASREYVEEPETITNGRLVVPSDEQIDTITVEDDRYHQLRLEFFGQSIKSLKIKLCDDDAIYSEYEMSRPQQFRVSEITPFVTVKGAGKIPYELTTLILMK